MKQVTSSQQSNTMKAAYIQAYGPDETLSIGLRPLPTMSDNQVLIKVAAAGVNPVDFHIRNGMIAETGTHTLPLTLGWDAAGTVVEKGHDVSNLEIADEVFVFAPIDQQGTYAQYVVVDANLVTHKPKTLTMNESAGVPLAAVTAWQSLFDEGKLSSGQRVLIIGASGGVGGFAVQIAKASGAHVIACSSGKNAAYVKSLGADEFIDYKTTKFEDVVQDVDLVLVISSGGDLVARALSVVRKGGVVVSTLDDADEQSIAKSGAHFSRMWVQPNAEDLSQIGNMIDDGAIKVNVDRIYPLADVNEAIKRSEAQLAVGKIIIAIDE